jgi:multicomponent Na+:H+ antiporter subunit C
VTLEFVVGRYAYVLIATLLAIGLYGMMLKRNLLKKVIGMTIFQTAIYLLFIQGATKRGATIPVRAEEFGTEAAAYINPLPQVIVLTAIVVGVAITGVALSLILLIQRSHGTLDEEAILDDMRTSA